MRFPDGDLAGLFPSTVAAKRRAPIALRNDASKVHTPAE
jgi:hypothetical protein